MNLKQPNAPLQRRAFTVQQQFQFEVAKEHQRFADQDRHFQQLLSEGSSSDEEYANQPEDVSQLDIGQRLALFRKKKPEVTP